MHGNIVKRNTFVLFKRSLGCLRTFDVSISYFLVDLNLNSSFAPWQKSNKSCITLATLRNSGKFLPLTYFATFNILKCSCDLGWHSWEDISDWFGEPWIYSLYTIIKSPHTRSFEVVWLPFSTMIEYCARVTLQTHWLQFRWSRFKSTSIENVEISTLKR